MCSSVCCGGVAGGAQVSTGEIFGKATDGTGAVLPGVDGHAERSSLIQPLVALTTETGAYRFPRIPIGTYTVSFELTGFKKFVRSDIIIQAGFNAEVNAKLEISTVQETVTVSGASPVVDTQSTTLSASFTKEALDKIPNARDPWVIIEQTPGVMMSGANVGGNLSGQQTSFSAMGSGTNQQWNINGAVISDIASGNSSPTYYDFDSFEEIQITTAGADASQQGAGVQVNFITRSGSNNFTGYAPLLQHQRRVLRQVRQLPVDQRHRRDAQPRRRRRQSDSEHSRHGRAARRADQAEQGVVLGRDVAPGRARRRARLLRHREVAAVRRWRTPARAPRIRTARS